MKDTMRELMVAEIDQVAGGVTTFGSFSATQSNSASQSASNTNSGAGTATASNSSSQVSTSGSPTAFAAASGIAQANYQSIYQRNSARVYGNS